MPKIIFQKSDLEIEWDASAENILELAETHGLDLAYGCRAGNCTACQQKVVGGEITYPMDHTGQPDEGCVLLCCCIPKSNEDLVIDA